MRAAPATLNGSLAVMPNSILLSNPPTASAATKQHDFVVALEHALKRKAAGVTREDELPQAAPPEVPEEELPIPALRVAPAE